MVIFLITISVLLTVALAALLVVYFRLRDSQSNALTDQALQEKFKLIALEALEGNSERFLNVAKTTLEKESVLAKSELEKQKMAINHIVDPLKQQLDDYQRYFQTLERERQKSYSQVEIELKRIADLSQTLSHETSALKNALKKPHVRGRWGEVQLKNCVELAGMSEYADVTFQDSTTLSDGSRLIPDMIVRMPGQRMVIVDAKTPLDAFISSLEAIDEETRAAEILRHGRHVKEHIKKLAQKDYQQNLKNSADFIVLFLPNESFLYAALETEPDLMEYAIGKKILIATPPTLIGLLKVIRYGWNEERLAENAQKISEVGMELHKRLVDFIDGFVDIGLHIEKAHEQYRAGMTRLESRVISQAKKLEQLGAKSVKELP